MYGAGEGGLQRVRVVQEALPTVAGSGGCGQSAYVRSLSSLLRNRKARSLQRFVTYDRRIKLLPVVHSRYSRLALTYEGIVRDRVA